MRLAGVTIAVTRARHQAGDLLRLIEAEGGSAVHFPTIEVGPPDDWAGCDAAIAALDRFDGLIFTSANAVSGFLDRMDASGIPVSSLSGRRIFAVGDATARALSARGLRVAAVPDRFTGPDLARTIGEGGAAGRNYLFPSGNLAMDSLPAMLRSQGAEVTAVGVYATRPPSPDDVDGFYGKVRDGRIDWITFTSPSTVANFARLFPAGRAGIIRSTTRIAAIGPTTAAAAAEAGFPALVTASRAGARELVDAICERVALIRRR